MGTDLGTSCWVSSPPLGRPLEVEREAKARVVGIVSQRTSKSSQTRPQTFSEPRLGQKAITETCTGLKAGDTNLPKQEVF